MPRPTVSHDDRTASRDRLIALALALYQQEGIEAVSFRRLAEAAGISHTLPYRYFASKEALLGALRAECTTRFEHFVHGREQRGATARVRIRAIAAAYVAFVEAHPAEYALVFSLQQPSPDTVPELLAARQRLFEHAVETVAAAIAEGALAGDAREITHLFWAGLHGLMTLHLAGQLVHGRSLAELAEPLMTRLIGPVPRVLTVAAPESTQAVRKRRRAT